MGYGKEPNEREQGPGGKYIMKRKEGRMVTAKKDKNETKN